MPLYEYQCTVCNERSEILRNISDPPYTHCPKCGGEVKKLFSAPAIQFKGSGFYKTDYAAKPTTKLDAKSSDTKSESPSSNAETKSETKTETKSETKSEAKSEAKSESKSETKSD